MPNEKQKKTQKRELIETMEEDLKRLREKKAEEERKKLLEISERKSSEKIKKPQEVLEREIPEQQKEKAKVVPSPPLEFEPEEKQKKTQKRELIETMEEDLKRLREKKAEEIKKKKEALERKILEQQKEKSKVVPSPPPPPREFEPGGKQKKTRNWRSLIEKISIRLVYILIFLLLIGGLTHFYYQKTTPLQSPPQTQTPSLPQKQEIALPKELFSVNYVKIISVEDINSLQPTLSNFLDNDFNKFGFYEIFFKKNETELYSPNEILPALISFPKELKKLINLNDNSNFMFFVYNNAASKKIGFVIKIAPENKTLLSKAMKNWEKNMEKDTAQFFAIVPEAKDQYYKSYFIEKTYLGYPIRFQTFSKNDYGICYALPDNYLIITSSLESITKVVSLLKNNSF